MNSQIQTGLSTNVIAGCFNLLSKKENFGSVCTKVREAGFSGVQFHPRLYVPVSGYKNFNLSILSATLPNRIARAQGYKDKADRAIFEDFLKAHKDAKFSVITNTFLAAERKASMLTSSNAVKGEKYVLDLRNWKASDLLNNLNPLLLKNECEVIGVQLNVQKKHEWNDLCGPVVDAPPGSLMSNLGILLKVYRGLGKPPPPLFLSGDTWIFNKSLLPLSEIDFEKLARFNQNIRSYFVYL